jgi:hypothetical protein
MSDYDRVLKARERWAGRKPIEGTPGAGFLDHVHLDPKHWHQLGWDAELEALLAPVSNVVGEHVANLVTLINEHVEWESEEPAVVGDVLTTYCGGPHGIAFMTNSRPISILGICRLPWVALRLRDQTRIPWWAIGDLPVGRTPIPKGVEKVIVPRGERIYERRGKFMAAACPL